MMECPNCKMSINASSTFCIHCGTQLGAMGSQGTNSGAQPMPNNNQAMSSVPPVQNNMPAQGIQSNMSNPEIQNNNMSTPVQNSSSVGLSGAQNSVSAPVQNNSQPVVNSSHESYAPSKPYKSRILVTLPALGILLVYFYYILTISILVIGYIRLGTSSIYSGAMRKALFTSKYFLTFFGIDLTLIVSFVLTVLHKKYMGFVAILFSISFVIYDFVKLHMAIMPIVASVVVLFCAIIYLNEEDPV